MTLQNLVWAREQRLPCPAAQLVLEAIADTQSPLAPPTDFDSLASRLAATFTPYQLNWQLTALQAHGLVKTRIEGGKSLIVVTTDDWMETLG